MASPFRNVRFHATESDDDEILELGSKPKGLRGGAARTGAVGVNFDNDEAAARFYLSRVLARDSRPAVRGVAGLGAPQSVPDMQVIREQNSPLTKTKLIAFEQTHASIPIFGSAANVELTPNRRLVAIDAEVTEIDQVSPIASVSAAEALNRIAAAAGVDAAALANVEAPVLTYYHDDVKDEWHLAHLFRNVPAAPAEFRTRAAKGKGHGLGRSPRELRPRLNYLVDAHDGAILRYYSAAPMLTVPVNIRGTDEDGKVQKFFGLKVNGGGFALHDPLRAIKTYNLAFGDLDGAFPADPIQGPEGDLGDGLKAAVSAHANAMVVHDFFKSVLLRDGIDDKGMDLISVVNVTYAEDQAPPEWHNAVWWNNRMWYGQIKEGNDFRSYSRFLDVIAHELTHGVTQYTSGLEYLDESGALSESFSDIFGIIIANWHRLGEHSDVDDWNWDLGAGLGKDGGPLRDLSDPTRTDDPDHYDKFVHTLDDSGGVHTNSGIHNKAAYNFLTAKDENGARVFTPKEVATIYYLCLSRLIPLATFQKTLQVLLDVTATFYAGDTDERDRKIAAIEKAYEKVGITLA